MLPPPPRPPPFKKRSRNISVSVCLDRTTEEVWFDLR
jgi:hypothetical protein